MSASEPRHRLLQVESLGRAGENPLEHPARESVDLARAHGLGRVHPFRPARDELRRFVQVEQVDGAQEVGREFVRLRVQKLRCDDGVEESDEGEVQLRRERGRVRGREEQDRVEQQGRAGPDGEGISVLVERQHHDPRVQRREEKVKQLLTLFGRQQTAAERVRGTIVIRLHERVFRRPCRSLDLIDRRVDLVERVRSVGRRSSDARVVVRRLAVFGRVR